MSVVTAVLSSCAVSIPNANFSVSDQHVDTEGYRVVKKVSGSASSAYILNVIGGFKSSSLIEEAREKAIKNANLKQGQSLAFETINDNLACYVILSVRTVTFNAYVIEKGEGQGFASSQKVQVTTPENKEIKADYNALVRKFLTENQLQYDADKFFVKKKYDEYEVIMSNGLIDVRLVKQLNSLWKATSKIENNKYSSKDLSM